MLFRSKLIRKGFPISLASARDNLNDIAGVRVICSYIDDIYLIEKLLTTQDDVQVVHRVNYIENPKPNGYRSLHLVVRVPVFLSTGSVRVKVEVQIRTIAMDFWASLEHELAYKLSESGLPGVMDELKECARVIASIDMRMQRLHDIAVRETNYDTKETFPI